MLKEIRLPETNSSPLKKWWLGDDPASFWVSCEEPPPPEEVETLFAAWTLGVYVTCPWFSRYRRILCSNYVVLNCINVSIYIVIKVDICELHHVFSHIATVELKTTPKSFVRGATSWKLYEIVGSNCCWWIFVQSLFFSSNYPFYTYRIIATPSCLPWELHHRGKNGATDLQGSDP